jgi:hypothetical protein
MRIELIAGGVLIALLFAQLVLLIREHLKKRPSHIENTNKKENPTDRERDIR